MALLFRQLLAAALALLISLPARPVANDRLSTDTYDANGNTTASNFTGLATGYVYDFENHLISANGITYVYDGDGHRISKTKSGVTTTFATTDLNPTGYSQLVSESYSPNTPSSEHQHDYIIGLEPVLELRQHYDSHLNNNTQQMWFVFDGHGSVRGITDQNGNVTDTYDYDAFGVLTHSTGTTPNTTLFAGEQYDPDLSLYFNRARYLNVSTGRFWSMDTFEGDDESPVSLHKYLYASAGPVDRSDPSGNFDLTELGTVQGVINTLNTATRTISTALKVYNFASNVISLSEYVPLALDILQAFGEPSPALAEQAVVQAVERKFGPLGISNLTGNLSRAFSLLRPSWGQISGAIEREAPVMAERIAAEVARRMPKYLELEAEGRLKVMFFMPTGPGPRSPDVPISVGSTTELEVGITGGRLFGLGIRTSAGSYDQVYRLDYWEPFSLEPFQIHYHVYSDQDFPATKIWP